jgi:PilZ domain
VGESSGGVPPVKGPGNSADMPFMQERRSEVRMLCADMVKVSWKDALGKRRRTTGLLEDISPSGACLQLENSVPQGAEIRWACPTREFTGIVRYCVYREIGYFIGVEFKEGSRWSRRAYKPQHYLDLQQLVSKAK